MGLLAELADEDFLASDLFETGIADVVAAVEGMGQSFDLESSKTLAALLGFLHLIFIHS